MPEHTLDLTVYDIDEDEEGCTRLHVNTNAPFGSAEADANARLIAAAPDLLIALRMMGWGTAHHPACRSFKGPTCDCAHAEARNAIAKATESTN